MGAARFRQYRAENSSQPADTFMVKKRAPSMKGTIRDIEYVRFNQRTTTCRTINHPAYRVAKASA